MMKACALTFAALLAAPAAAQQAPLRADNFNHTSAITLTGAGPFHQAVLPMALYQGVERQDLGDIRVFNGQGETVPHALLRSQSSSVSQVHEMPLPLFPIHASQDKTGAPDLSVLVRRHADGTLVSVRQAPQPAGGGALLRGVVVDASKLERGLQSLRLDAGPVAAPFHAYTIETSDDLQQWRLLKGDAQLVRLEHAGQRIEKNLAEWPGEAGKYLRILWADPQQAPAITAVTGRMQEQATDNAPTIWSAPISAALTQNNIYDYTLPGRMPLELLRINLPQANTLAPVELQQAVSARRRHREQAGWQTITQAVAFRLNSPQGEITSPDIALDWPSQHRLRLVADARSGGLGTQPPSLQVGFVPHILVFLARGEGPFTLAWGAQNTANAALPVATLIPGYRSDKKLTASPATLAAVTPAQAATPIVSAPDQPVSKGALWAILIAGVLVLAGMVWMLVRQMKQKDTPQA